MTSPWWASKRQPSATVSTPNAKRYARRTASVAASALRSGASRILCVAEAVLGARAFTTPKQCPTRRRLGAQPSKLAVIRLARLQGPCCGFCGCAMSRPSLSSTTIPCGGVNGHSPNRFDSSACPKRAALLAFSSGSGDGHRRRTADVVSAAVLSFPSLSRHPRGPIRSLNPQTLFCSCHVSTSV